MRPRPLPAVGGTAPYELLTVGSRWIWSCPSSSAEAVGREPTRSNSSPQGWAGCFLSALQTVAGKKADLSAAQLTVSVSVLKTVRGEFDLATVLDLDPIGVDGADPHELMRKAHVICPYSRATRGNISVVLKVSGVPVEAPEPV